VDPEEGCTHADEDDVAGTCDKAGLNGGHARPPNWRTEGSPIMAHRSALEDLGGQAGGAPPVLRRSPAGRTRKSSSLPIDIIALCETVVPALSGRRGIPPAELGRVEAFLELLIDEEDDGFEKFLLEASAESADPQAMVTDLLAPAACLLGDYWRMDVCDFMKVTVVMARIQRLFWTLTSLYPPLAVQRTGRTALLSPAPQEQHGFGLVVVEDALRRAGWQVDRCCVDEEDMFFELLAANDYAVVGLSLSGTAKSPGLASFIRKTRRKSRSASARILVGGSVFVEKPDLAYEAGADLLALDALSAVNVAEAAAASRDRGC
jgi:methanogenic corrinoid protein MtbC1